MLILWRQRSIYPFLRLFPKLMFFTLLATGIVSLEKYLLPPAAPALNLLYAVGLLLGFEPATLQNVCGDADWQAIQKVSDTFAVAVLLCANFALL